MDNKITKETLLWLGEDKMLTAIEFHVQSILIQTNK
jgi:hypothetical protein